MSSKLIRPDPTGGSLLQRSLHPIASGEGNINQFIEQKERSATYIDMHEIM